MLSVFMRKIESILRSHHLSGILRIPEIMTRSSSIELRHLLEKVVEEAGLTPLSCAAFDFEPQGASVVLLLKESHIAIHVWPELCKMTVDIHVCDFSDDNLERAQLLAKLLTFSDNFPENINQWNLQTVSG